MLKKWGTGQGCSQDEDGGIDEECDEQREGAVPSAIADSHALAEGGARVGARLNDGRMQVQIVWHHGGTCVHMLLIT